MMSNTVLLRVSVTKIIEVPAFTETEAALGDTVEDWYAGHFATGDSSLDLGEYADIDVEDVQIVRVDTPDAPTFTATAREG
jgi:hypothetical protein